jgi:hypothetical protein
MPGVRALSKVELRNKKVFIRRFHPGYIIILLSMEHLYLSFTFRI